MTPENQITDIIDIIKGQLGVGLAEESIERLEEEGIIKQLSLEPTPLPSEKEVNQPNQPSRELLPPLVNPQITPPEVLSELVRGLPRPVLRTVKILFEQPPDTIAQEKVAPQVTLPEWSRRSRKEPAYLPGKELRTPGDRLRVRNGLWIKGSRAKGIGELASCLASKTSAEESVSRAARKILRKKEQSNEELEAKACSRVRADLRWFLKHLRPYQQRKVYQVFGQRGKRQEVKTMFINPEWRQTYKVILENFGSLSVHRFMFQLTTLLPRGYSNF